MPVGILISVHSVAFYLHNLESNITFFDRELRSENHQILKFIYSERATKFCEISTLILSYVVPVKSKVEISQNFVAFSE